MLIMNIHSKFFFFYEGRLIRREDRNIMWYRRREQRRRRTYSYYFNVMVVLILLSPCTHMRPSTFEFRIVLSKFLYQQSSSSPGTPHSWGAYGRTNRGGGDSRCLCRGFAYVHEDVLRFFATAFRIAIRRHSLTVQPQARTLLFLRSYYK